MWWRKEIGMSISALDDEVFCCAQFGGFSGAFSGVEHFSEEYVAQCSMGLWWQDF